MGDSREPAGRLTVTKGCCGSGRHGTGLPIRQAGSSVVVGRRTAHHVGPSVPPSRKGTLICSTPIVVTQTQLITGRARAVQANGASPKRRGSLGRPYIQELEQLRTTYDWALGVDIDRLAAAIHDVTHLPLAAVGSGGSLTVAEFAVHLHERHCGLLSRAFTPLSAVHSPINFRHCGVFMATASGRNPDVLGSYRRLAASEPRHLLILCLAKDSPVARLAARHTIANVVEMVPPVTRDGFLATNSLLASVVLLLRAYAEAFGVATGLPQLWTSLFPEEARRKLATALRPTWAKQTHIVLHGATSRIAALDLESKFSEGALGNLWTSDYRDFAHGRHYWLAKRGASTAVLAFVGPEELSLADRTLSLIPEAVHIVREHIPFEGSVGEVRRPRPRDARRRPQRASS